MKNGTLTGLTVRICRGSSQSVHHHMLWNNPCLYIFFFFFLQPSRMIPKIFFNSVIFKFSYVIILGTAVNKE
jgi:hypothetical protein